MPEQLTFAWPAGVALTAGDFFVSEANQAAHLMVTHPASWPERKLALIGPMASGKSHLARVFADQEGARTIAAASLSTDAQQAEGPVVVEDVDRLPHAAEEPLFHLHNNLRDAGHALLLTARVPPAQWPLRLPDLASRFSTIALAHISDPDDALLSAVIMKLFADRQISTSRDLSDYLALRIERSFGAAVEIVDTLDKIALRDKRKVNEHLAREVLTGRRNLGET